MTIFDRVPLSDLRRRTSEKWRRYPADVLPLWVAEMDVPVADVVVRAVHDALTAGDTGYHEGSALAEALAEFAAKRWAWQVDPGRVRLVPDVMQGIAEVVRVVTGPGDAVVINPPVYPPFTSFVEHAGRRVEHAPLGADGRLDLAQLDAAFARATAGGGRAAYLLCHPHNPTAALHTRDELAAVGELAARHGVQVVADEIHAPVVLDGEFVPTTTVVPGAIALHSASKAFNLAGLRAAVVVPGPDADVAGISPVLADGVSHVAAIAQVAAYRDGGAYLDEVLDGLRANVTTLQSLLASQVPAVAWRPPAATYFAWLDLGSITDDPDPARALLARGRLAVNRGPSFGPGGEHHVRLNLAASTEVLTEAVRRIAATFA
ncbi:MalY/PatB family protein [Cellulomonas alba]|uniref:Aminotransferase n=1 Tax=Cellulomonas alba TaxID=3053467 RepID=A0ABT7SI65_9CELL|nr:aminotransferase class I/II-fold pyridoxal phosphate-dependent enzyme [Cellulomonas alba]MDM7855880.1 aminotransferase class I/II-fold pyridoxal phosphate-dependent enzyme [Cellulomonas alba]